MKNKSVVVVMCLVLIFTSVINYSQVNAEKRKPDYIEIRENSELENVSDEILNNTEAIVVSDELEKQNIEELNEVMDNGTGIIIEGDTVEEVQDYFNVDTKVSSENEMGCYVYKNGEDVSVAPIECDIMLDDEKNESATATDIRSIIENEEIDYEQVISDYEALKSEDKLKKISNKKLQCFKVALI